MESFDHIAVIYNPNSTGNAEQLAQSFAASVKKHQKNLGVTATLVPTKRAKHAIALAKQVAIKYKRPLIVSSSGDGGYNEVINGVMQAKLHNGSVSPVVAVLAAGNANDYKRVMRGESKLIDFILHSKPKPFDLIRVEIGEMSRYAHSYIGFGVSADVGDKIDDSDGRLLSEASLVAQTLQEYEPFRVRRHGIVKLYDSLIFANISQMAKIVKLDDKHTVSDGKFELVVHQHYNRLRSALAMLSTALFGAPKPKSYSSYSFETTATALQLDGEVEKLKHTGYKSVEVTSVKHAVESFYV